MTDQGPITAAPSPLRKDWADEVRSILVGDRVPGAAISIIQPDGVSEMMYGTANIETGAPVERTSGFQLCSVTKAYVATLALLLEQAGVFSLDDPVAAVVPEFSPQPAWLVDEIRFRDLLSNRLGVSRGGFSDYGLCDRFDYVELARRMSHMPRTGLFRGQYSYCNPAFSVTVLAMQRLTGKSFPELLQEHVLGPAGLTRTLMGPGARADKTRAWAHTIDRREQLVVVDFEDDWARPGAGGIMSSAADQQRWLQLNLGRGRIDGRQVLPAAIWDQLWQPHIFFTPEQRELSVGDLNAKFAAYGLGWFLSTYHGRSMVVHTGGGVGWRTRSILLPEEGIAISVLLNVDGKTGTAIQHMLLERALGLSPQPWVEIVRTDRAKRLNATLAGLDAKYPKSPEQSWDTGRIAGLYRNAESGTAEVLSEDGGVAIRFVDGPTYDGELRPLGGPVYSHELDGPFATYDGPNAPSQRVRFEESGGEVKRLIHSYIGSFDRC